MTRFQPSQPSTLLLCALFAACTTSPLSHSEGTIDARGGSLETVLSSGEHVRVTVPTNAVTSETVFEILELGSVSALPNGMHSAGPAFQLAPEGALFAEPVRIEIIAEHRPDSLLTRPHAIGAWTPVAGTTYDEATHTLSASLMHFSDFVPADVDDLVAEDAGVPDSTMPDSSVPDLGTSTPDAGTPVACDWAIDLASVATIESDGSIHYTTTHTGGTEHAYARCGEGRWLGDGTDIAFAYVPTQTGIVDIDFIGSDEHIDFYGRTSCEDESTEAFCHSGDYANTGHYSFFATEGTPLYIMASGHSVGDTGSFTINIQPHSFLPAGAACDATTRCLPGFTCVGAEGSSTCTAIDSGCGIGTRVIDLTPHLVGNSVTYTDTTRYSTNVMRGDCDQGAAFAHSGYMAGPWGGPENVHSLVMPVDGEIEVQVYGHREFFPDLDVRTTCSTNDLIGGLACSEGYYGPTTIPARSIARQRAGSTVYFVVDSTTDCDGRYAGTYTLDIAIIPSAHEGDSCGSGVADPHCAVGSSCEPSGFMLQCEATVCGDAVVAGEESCEDGNSTSGDGCDACALENQGAGGTTCATGKALVLARDSFTSQSALAYGETSYAAPSAHYNFTLVRRQRVEIALVPRSAYYANLELRRGCSSLAEILGSAGTSAGHYYPSLAGELEPGTYYIGIGGHVLDGVPVDASMGQYKLMLRTTDL